MNLSRVQKVGEDDDYFHLHDGKGNFSVAKKALRPETRKQIEQHFADGGEAKDTNFTPADDGGYSPVAPPNQSSNVLGQAISGIPGMLGNAISSGVNSMVGGDEQTSEPVAVEKPAPEKQPQAEPESDLIDQIGMPKAPKVSAIKSGPNYDKQINAAADQETDALKDQAKNTADMQNALATSHATTMQNVQNRITQADKDFADNKATHDKLAADIASSKIDPNQLWANKTTGEKIGSAFALILGGIGAGMTHGPNQALEIMQKAIERDVDAQKANLGKKQSAIAGYVAQGHEIRQAEQMTIAHEMAMGEGQLQQLVAKYGALGANPAAQQAIAHINQDRNQRLINAHNESLTNSIKNEELTKLHFDNAIMGSQVAAMPLARAISNKASLGHGLNDREYLVGKQHGAIDPKLSIKLDDGKYYQAVDDKQAGEIRDAQQESIAVASVAQQIKAFRAAHSGGVTLDRGAVGRASQLKQELLSNLQGLAKKTPRGEELIKDFAKSVADPDSWGTNALINGQMDAAIDRANRLLSSATRARLQGGGGQSGGGLTIQHAGD